MPQASSTFRLTSGIEFEPGLRPWPTAGVRESASLLPIGGAVLQLSVSDLNACALLTDGRLRCWGLNMYGQLGYGHNGSIGYEITPESAGDVPYNLD